MKYKVGDKVRVRTDLKVGIRYSRRVFNEQMDHWSGRVVTIKKIAKEGAYIIREDGGRWFWVEEMFETNATDAIKPNYYQFHGYDVFDIAEHFGLSFPLGNALKYLLRAGKKDKAKEVEDLRKSIVCIRKAISLKERRNDTSNWRDDNAD